MTPMILRMYLDLRRRSGAGGHGKRARDALVEMYRFDSVCTTRDQLDEQLKVKMVASQDPNLYILGAEELLSDLAALEEPVTIGSTRT